MTHDRATGAVVRHTLAFGGGLALVIGAFVFLGGAASASTPSVLLTPQPKGGQYENNQTIQVSLGPNSMFPPNSRIVILECADPGGDAAHLPVSLGTCDENTVQADTVLVGADGSFSEKSYPIFSLPNSTFGEQANWQPVCDATSQCVLFVGENQNDFTQPKLFSAPFAVTGTTAAVTSSSTIPTVTATTGAAPASSNAVSAQVSLPATTLAFTGWSPWVTVVAIMGFVLVALSSALWLLAKRSEL